MKKHLLKLLVQVLFTSPEGYTFDAFREKLRLAFKGHGNEELRQLASIDNYQLINSVMEVNEYLARAGLQIQTHNGFMRMITTPIESAMLPLLFKEQTVEKMPQTTLEVLACVAFKQPITQAEINEIFGTDKRDTITRLVNEGIIARVHMDGGRLVCVTTEEFLKRYKLKSIGELINSENKSDKSPTNHGQMSDVS